MLDSKALKASGYLPKGLTPAGLTKALAGSRLGQKPEWLVRERSRSLSAAFPEPQG